MTRTAFPFQVDDLSALARSLHRQLAETPEPVSHLSLMNMLARAAGFRNFQHFRAMSVEGDKRSNPAPTPDMARVETARRYFDAEGRLMTWPAKTSVQHLVMWALWAKLPADQAMTEREISAELNARHLFGDAAILRRTLWELKLVTRSLDGSAYRRVGQQPGPEARALIRALRPAPQTVPGSAGPVNSG